ncbi:MAG: O-antigen ligase family protein [Candidatus Peribacteraceae bacterium]|nr:O-antigen ligase family protein [Candidatus Peribacteraceae bacterium]
MLSISRFNIEKIALCVSIAILILWKGGKAVDATWMVGTLAIFLTTIDCLRSRPSKKIPMVLLLLIGAWCVWTVLSFVVSTTMNYGLDEVLQTISLSLVFLWALRRSGNNVDRYSLEARIAQTISVAVLLACALGIAVYIFQPVSRFVGSFFDYRFHTDYWPNAWGEFVLLAWPMLVWTLWSKPLTKLSGSSFWLRSLTIGLLLGCLLLSYSRGSLLALGVQLVLSACLMVFGRLKLPIKKTGIVLATATLTAVILFVGINSIRSQTYAVESVIKKATFTSAEKASSVSERSQFWQQATTLTKAHPFLGWGPYSFRFVQPQLQQDILATTDHPHNVLLKLAMERGIPAAVFFGLIFLIVFGLHLHSLRPSKREQHDTTTRWFVLASFVAIAGVLAHNMIDYNLQFVGISLPLWVLAGLGSGIALRREATLQSNAVTFEHTGRLLVAVILLSVLIIEGRYLYLSSKGRHAEAAGDMQTALDYYDATTQSLFTRDTLLSTANLHLKRGEMQKASENIEAYMKQNIEDGRAWKLKGNSEEAQNMSPRESYKRAFGILRYNDVSTIVSYVQFLEQSDRAMLDDKRKEIESLMNDYQLAVENNVHFIAQSSNVEALVELSHVMSKAYPDEREAYEELAVSVMQKATQERAKETGRPSGILW